MRYQNKNGYSSNNVPVSKFNTYWYVILNYIRTFSPSICIGNGMPNVEYHTKESRLYYSLKPLSSNKFLSLDNRKSKQRNNLLKIIIIKVKQGL
ncbi:MAG: hypothetical protein LBO06_08580 [Bacteroidales bacterium]|jgi:hypothetical protein|nr:hypothetical protein [Bacteroidales bacterium]